MRFRLLDTVGGRAMRVLTLFMLLCSIYDAFGNRATKTVGGVTTTYLVDDDANPTGYAQVLDELQNGAVTRSYSYGLQRISQTQVVSNAVTTSYYGYDGGGNVRQLTNASGAVTDSYDYDAFGNAINTAGNTPNVYLYRGEQYDSDLGLYYLRARYYNLKTGRFVNRDPSNGIITDPKTLHKYLYADGDPVNLSDPTGRAGEGVMNPPYKPGAIEYALVIGLISLEAAKSSPLVTDAIKCIYHTISDALGIVATLGVPVLEPSGCTAKCKPRTVEDIKANCTPVGPPVIEPSRSFKGCTSYEQEYSCGCGHPYSIHWIVCGDDPNGPPVHGPHPRPGPPKGGSE